MLFVMGGRSSAVSLTVLALLFAAPASAHDFASPAVAPATAADALGDDVERLDNGLFRVEATAGPPLLTHGPDPVADYLPSDRRAAPTRAPVCGTDHVQHVLVGRLEGLPDRTAAVAGQVRASLARANAMLAGESVASGGPAADFRVECDGAGAVRVDSFAASSPQFDDIVSAARAAGFNRQDANYTIFFDAPALGDFCGMASYVSDSRLAADNRNNDGGAYAVTYQPCWDSTAVMHEIAHNQGAVQPGGPNSTGTGGHCNQMLDVVCVAPDGGDRNQVPTLACAAEVRFDCGFDDYFDSAPEPGEYLATHWNIGSPLNRFVAFGGPAPDAASETPPSCARPACATALRLGSPVAGNLAAGESALYRLEVPRGARSLRVGLAPGSGLELRVRRGRLPLASSAGCAPAACRVDRPRRGPWYAIVSASTATDFEITARAR